MSRASSIVKTVGATVAFGLLAGWSVYRDSPQGLLRAPSADSCPAVTHSFTSVYMVILGVGAGLALTVAASIFIASLLGIFDRSQSNLKAISVTSVLLAVALAAAMLLKFPLERAFPLVPQPGCAKLASIAMLQTPHDATPRSHRHVLYRTA